MVCSPVPAPNQQKLGMKKQELYGARYIPLVMIDILTYCLKRLSNSYSGYKKAPQSVILQTETQYSECV